MRTRTVVFVIAALLFSVLAVSLHVHADGALHDDCPACLAGRYQAAICPSPVHSADPCLTESLLALSAPVFPENIAFSSPSTRAPPA